MATITRFEDLEIWQMSRVLCKMIHSYTIKENFSKDFKLVNQINSSSGSVMDNIAEGFGRASRKEFVQFLSISKGSAEECKSQLYRAFDRNYITETEFNESYNLADEISSKIYRFINYLNKTETQGIKFKDRVGEPESIYQTNFDLPF